jgi:PST family polysaccharide transporter
MRFTALAVIGVASLIVGTAIAIGEAMAGYGYWALVAIASPLTGTILVWLATRWVPGTQRRRVGIRSMMGYGSTLTLYGLIGHVVTNLEKVLLGSFWGSGEDSRRPCK